MTASSRTLGIGMAWAMLALAACVYDSSERCGAAMTFVESTNSCVCNPNAVAVPGGCQLCAADEVAVDGVCTCAAGSCNKRCASNADCGAAYTCATWDAEPTCRTFEGVGDACTSAADCTGDANFCDTFQTHSCGIAGCSLTANDCPRGTMCCDFSSFGLGTLCAGVCL